MGFIALLITLLIEQFRPLPARSTLGAALDSVADATERGMNAGESRHGVYAWLVLVAGSALAGAALYALAWQVSALLALAVNVAALYLTMGLRQFSHPITAIRTALDGGDADGARRILSDWLRHEEAAPETAGLPVDEVVRLTMERGLLLSHRRVFGVFFWFVLLPGPTGPILYRGAEYLARRWNRPAAPGVTADRFGEFARRAFAWIDWLPLRLTALGFAIVGDFEGAIDGWRRATARPRPAAPGLPAPDDRTLLLAAGGGALGLRLLVASEVARLYDATGQEGAGLAEPDPRRLHSGIGLVWRALILWLVLLLLLSLAGALT